MHVSGAEGSETIDAGGRRTTTLCSNGFRKGCLEGVSKCLPGHFSERMLFPLHTSGVEKCTSSGYVNFTTSLIRDHLYVYRNYY